MLRFVLLSSFLRQNAVGMGGTGVYEYGCSKGLTLVFANVSFSRLALPYHRVKSIVREQCCTWRI